MLRFRRNLMLKRSRNWSEGSTSQSAGKVVAHGLLKPQETGLKYSGRGLFIPSSPCLVWGEKGTFSLFLPFFHTGMGTEQAHPCGFPSKYPPPAQIQGSVVFQNMGEAACGGGSGPSVWGLLIFWVQSRIFGRSSSFVLGRAVSAPFLGAGHAWQSLWSFVVVTFASRAFSQSKLTVFFQPRQD